MTPPYLIFSNYMLIGASKEKPEDFPKKDYMKVSEKTLESALKMGLPLLKKEQKINPK